MRVTKGGRRATGNKHERTQIQLLSDGHTDVPDTDASSFTVHPVSRSVMTAPDNKDTHRQRDTHT